MGIWRHLTAVALAAALLLGGGAAGAAPWPDLKEWKAHGGGENDAALIAVAEKYAFVPGVPGALQNGEAWFNYLRKTRGVRRERITYLRNEEVTKEALEEKAAEAASEVGAGGTLWFVFVGHGAASRSGGEGMLIGADAQQTEKSLYARSVEQSLLLGKLAASKAGRIVAVMDSCFSGRTTTGEALGKGLQPLLLQRRANALDPRTVVLSAAQGDEFAGALPGAERPAFSYLVLGGLRGWARDDGTGDVTAGDLQAYAAGALRSLLGASRKQTPALEGANTTPLGRGWEKGPDLDTFVLRRSDEGKEGASSAVAPAASTSEAACAAGTLRSADTRGRCCWPGQVWSTRDARCLGVPTSCPEGHLASVEKQRCELAACPLHRTRTEDGVHCCWPAQQWSTTRGVCVGVPACSDGERAQGETCIAPEGFVGSNLPPSMARKVAELAGLGVRITWAAIRDEKADASALGWGRNTYWAWNAGQGPWDALGALHKAGSEVRAVTYSFEGASALLSPQGFYGYGMPPRMFAKLVGFLKANQLGDVKCAAFAPKGGGLVLHGKNEFWSEGIPEAALAKVREYASAGAQLDYVAFSPKDDGFVILVNGGAAFWGWNLPDGLFGAMQEATRRGQRLRQVAIGPNGGWLFLTAP